MANPLTTQKLNFDSLNRLITNFRKDGSSRHSLAYFEARLARLEERWKACEDMHVQVHTQLQGEANKAIRQKYVDEYGQLEELALEYLTVFREGVYQYQAGATGQPPLATSANETIQLERVKIPVFDGSYGSWIAFRDLVCSLVHDNTGLSRVQKMQYLRSNLRGEAEKLTSHLNIVGDNYDAAWSMLCEQYDNNKMIAQQLIQRCWSAGTNHTDPVRNIKDMVNTTNQLTASLKTLKVDGFDLTMVFILNTKLDKDTRAEWQKLISDSKDVPTLQRFIAFLTQRSTMLEALTLSKPCLESKPFKKSTAHTVQVCSTRCSVCKGPHRLFKCDLINKAPIDTRREMVKSNKLCFNCLSDQHGAKQCQSKKSCKICSKRHNTLLHANDIKDSSSKDPSSAKGTTAQTQAHNAMLRNTKVLLATALIPVISQHGESIQLRALLDIGSQRSFITESAVQRLELTRKQSKICIGGIGGSDAVTTRGIVEVIATTGSHTPDERVKFSALILPKITAIIPATSMNVTIPAHIRKLRLADPGFNLSSNIDLLLGADIYGSVLNQGFISGQPCAQNTKFGWVLFGPAHVRNATNTSSFVALDELDNTLKRFWEIEEPVLKTLQFYVDDLLTGSDDLSSLKRLQTELRAVLRKGGFNLRKWSANHPALLTAIPEKDRENQKPLDIALCEEVKTLGLQWHPAKDVFSFKVQPTSETQLTKRTILSDVAKLFDPLGWLQPCIIIGKITLQKLWLLQLGWDDELPPAAIKEWTETRQQLPMIEALHIPRWNGCAGNTTIELHGFCDASNAAYAAAIYIRVVTPDGQVSSSLVTAKSKVAPLKTISIPRLELSGAVLLVQTMKQLKQACRWMDCRTHYWTDSKIVLSWIQKPAATWKVFVGNRVSQIHEDSMPTEWHHVASKDNPADLASRGVRPEQLVQSVLWWKGPEWLRDRTIPAVRDSALSALEEAAISEEARPVTLIAIEPNPEPEFLCKYSSLPKLLRVVAQIRRFVHDASHPRDKRIGPLSVDEQQAAKITCIRMSQQYAFPQELSALRNKAELHSSSVLKPLTPWIDNHGVLRVGGRLHHAPLDNNAKHPVILPRDSLVKLVVRQVHLTTLHGGTQLVLATLRQNFWITKGQSFVKSVLHECVACFRSIARPGNQLMGQLPPSRFQMEKPFAETGLDYAGPLTIKWNGGRGAKTAKAYIAVFVCLATKAFHLEAVSDLSTSACIAAVRRFIARRGKCNTIYSDCGTNFIGGEKQLKAAFKEASKQCEELLANEEIQWKFIPPGSPHFGGLWEAGVKSVKRHLIRTIGQHLVT